MPDNGRNANWAKWVHASTNRSSSCTHNPIGQSGTIRKPAFVFRAGAQWAARNGALAADARHYGERNSVPAECSRVDGNLTSVSDPNKW
jgi:hypothetical protein